MFLFLFVSNIQIDKNDKLYFGRSHNYGTLYSYSVAEIYISSDSIMTRYDYKLPNKKEWKNYKNYPSHKEVNKISKRGKFYYLINPQNGLENETHYLRITNRKLTYYYKDSENNFTKGYTFIRKE